MRTYNPDIYGLSYAHDIAEMVLGHEGEEILVVKQEYRPFFTHLPRHLGAPDPLLSTVPQPTTTTWSFIETLEYGRIASPGIVPSDPTDVICISTGRHLLRHNTDERWEVTEGNISVGHDHLLALGQDISSMRNNRYENGLLVFVGPKIEQHILRPYFIVALEEARAVYKP